MPNTRRRRADTSRKTKATSVAMDAGNDWWSWVLIGAILATSTVLYGFRWSLEALAVDFRAPARSARTSDVCGVIIGSVACGVRLEGTESGPNGLDPSVG